MSSIDKRSTRVVAAFKNIQFLNSPDLPHSEHDTNSSGSLVFLFSVASPRQKSQ